MRTLAFALDEKSVCQSVQKILCIFIYPAQHIIVVGDQYIMMHHKKTDARERQKGLTFANKDLRQNTFQDCIFEQCDFSYADLSNAHLENVKFLGCNLSCITLAQAHLQDVDFENCKLVGVDLHQCVSTFGSLHVSFVACVLNGCNFSNLKLAKTSFASSQLENCIFNSTDLSEADFSQVDLTNTLFHACNLQKSNLIGAKNYMIDPHNNNLKKARFRLPEAVSLLQFLDIDLTS